MQCFVTDMDIRKEMRSKSRVFLAALLLLVLLAAKANAQLTDPDNNSEGRNFFLATPASTFSNLFRYQHNIYVGTSSDVAGYSIISRDGTVSSSGQTTYSNPGRLTLNLFDAFHFIVDSSEFADRNLGFRVSSTADEPLFVLHTQGDGVFFSSFLSYPPSEFDEEVYEYMAISVQSIEDTVFESQIVIVASGNDTVFTVTPTANIELPQDAQVNSPLSSIAAKTRSHEITLHSMQTLRVASTFDLTGTTITSNKPLTVISGHQCGNVPINFNFCEQLAVQIPPTFTWGMKFLLAPFAIRTTGQYYRIVALENSTVVNYKESGADLNQQVVIPKAGGVATVYSAPGSYGYLSANKPVFVVQLATGGSPSTGGDGKGDPVMVIVSPIHTYISNTSFITLDSSFTHAISVTVDDGKEFDAESIIYNGNKLDCNWTSIENASGEVVGWGCTLANISDSSTHNIFHTEEGRVSVVSYGFTVAIGYGYLTGMNLKRADNRQTVGPEALVGDVIPYFDLETFKGVKELERMQDANSEPIFIPDGMIVGDRLVSSIFVSENGAFSFDKPWKFSYPNVFPTKYYYTQDSDVVAPFWSDNDIRKAGTVRYLSLSRGDNKEGDELMDTVLEYLERRDDIKISSSYAPTWMIVGQWDKVHPFPHGSNGHHGVSKEFLDLTNTYQGVIITDNIYSYYFFSYTCGEINWSTLGRESAVVGMNAHSQHFSNHPASGFASIGAVVSCTFISGSKRDAGDGNNGNGGEIPPDPALAEAKRFCDLFSKNRANNLSPFVLQTKIIPNVEECPPTFEHATNDARFHEDPNNSHCRLQSCPFFYETSTTSFSFVQQCCYDINSEGEIFKKLPDSGSLIAFDPVTHQKMYEEFDKNFRLFCCDQKGGCAKFETARPVDTGSAYGEPRGAHGIGDPHYYSLDGKRFRFQGLGDFVELELLSTDGNVMFQIQSRLHEFPLRAGATAHFAIALGEPGVLGFEIFAQGNQLIVHQTPEDKLINVMSNFSPAHEGASYQFKRHSSTSLTAQHCSGISVNSDWHFDFMNIYIQVPTRLKNSGRIRGIFGNFDGNASNEFATRDNPDIPITSANNNAQQQYDICLTWEVKEGESLFRTSVPTSRKKRATFQPIFFDELEFTDEQRALCKNDEDCLYDLVVTQDAGVAVTTLEAFEETARIEAILENFPPNLTGKATFPVTVGEEGIYTFIAEDKGDNFTVTVAGGLPEGAVLEENGAGQYIFRWLLQSADNISVTFLAIDSAGAASTLTPQVQVCGCVNGGICTLDGVFNLATETSVISNCICPEAYSGRFCDEDTNGCSEIECFEGVECFDVPAPGKGAKCGACPLGYNGDGEKCIDTDECSLDTSLCDHNCTNTVGSYVCVCDVGYELILGTGECRDIDECAGANACQQNCSNTVGSFECSCSKGFTLNANRRTCIANTLCEGIVGNCSHHCAVVDGMEQCFCPVGMKLSPDDPTVCIDINECVRYSPCDQNCTNIPGSFECLCKDGFELQDDFSCKDTDECMLAGLNGVDLCQESNKRCENTAGSFHCICVPGYAEVNGRCLRVMDAAPPPVIQSLPQSGTENSHTYTLTAVSADELKPDVLQKFRTVTAQAVNRFCNQTVCIVNQQNFTGLQVLPENVAIPLMSIVINSAGNPVLSFYVQINETVFLSAESLQLATESAEDLYREADLLVEIHVSDLRLMFTQDSPIVSGRNVTAYIKSNEIMAKMRCRITGLPEVDCTSGMVHYSNLPVREGNKAYTLRVEGKTADGRVHIIRRKLRIEQPGYCTIHLINNGVTVQGDTVTVEFSLTGSTVSTACIINPPKTKDNGFLTCRSPVILIPGSGKHLLKVVPQGCGRQKYPIKVEFQVPEE